jgi:4'-phosphopantetheinyl transferase
MFVRPRIGTLSVCMDTSTVWSVAPSRLVLPENEIHVWRTRLDREAEVICSLALTLSPDEKVRAERFHFANDRSHFVVARGILRRLLASYLNREPDELRFQYGPQGKPSLPAKDFRTPAIHFNLAHSHGNAVYAFARQHQVGIDIELIRDDFQVDEVAGRYFSSREIEELGKLPLTERAEGFFLGWTRKEAYIKARGEGLQIPLDGFDVRLTPSLPATFLRGVTPDWHLISFFASELCPGALVHDGALCAVRFYDCA